MAGTTEGPTLLMANTTYGRHYLGTNTAYEKKHEKVMTQGTGKVVVEAITV